MPSQEADRPLITRRDLCLGAGGVAVLAVLGAGRLAGASPVVRPPGGQDEGHVLSACIRCEKCYEVCPHRAIAPAHLEAGLVGMRTPVMDFSRGYCTFCEKDNDGRPLCVAACPSGALALDDDARAQDTLIGLAVIDECECLAFGVARCRRCVDACPYEAVKLDDAQQPYVIEDKCNGCGACESVCVSHKAGSGKDGSARRAIHVDPIASAGEVRRG